MREIAITNQVLKTEDKAKPTKSEEIAARSIVKTISWRIIGTLDTILISWLVTGTLYVAISIGSIELVTKMVLYFLHERAWNFIKWDKK
jgi:uncharacterized membrane protein